MEQKVEAKINFIEICLGSFEDYEEDESERRGYLRGKLARYAVEEDFKDQLKGYIRATEEKLEKQLDYLRQEKLKLSSKLFGISFFPLLLICFLSPPQLLAQVPSQPVGKFNFL
jgi:hypothetical protein